MARITHTVLSATAVFTALDVVVKQKSNKFQVKKNCSPSVKEGHPTHYAGISSSP